MNPLYVASIAHNRYEGVDIYSSPHLHGGVRVDEHEEQQEELHSPLISFNLISYIRTHTLTPVYGNTVWYLVPSTGCVISSVVGV